MTQALKRIAYVEDEADIRTVAQMALQMVGGYEVSLYASGEEALQKLPLSMPQLLLMDVMMPGQDGPTTLGELRKLPACADLPVIFMTAKAQQSEIAYYKSLGALDVITKPFDPMALSATVERIWTAHQS
ncbi:response regulator [Methylobacillus flagellatus]|uniref:response regulator n=1 Tax=Methylobacillus flagellatus TaxID=405 RepID=UPI0010F66A13|nr:response regulator [Methylobacillus flagellatus]